jgi:diguanylate cyclase (GGDEF)-like protein
MKTWEKIAETYRRFTGRATPPFRIDEFDPQVQLERQLRMVVLVRWAILEVLVVYAFLSYLFISPRLRILEAASAYRLAIVAVILMGAFNFILHFFHRRLATKQAINAGQIIMDLAGASLWVYYTGVSKSWFWILFMLVTLEASFLAEKKRFALLVAVGGSLCYGGILVLGYSTHMAPGGTFQDAWRLGANWAWVCLVNVCVALVGAYLVGEMRERGRLLTRMAMRDGLTGLYDSRYFFRALARELERSKRFNHSASILMLDVDHLKAVNDALGHLCGNRLLQMVAKVCRQNIRSGKEEGTDIDIACRFGGDEFTIVLPEVSRENALGVARRIRSRLMGQLERFLSVEVGSKEKQEALLSRGTGISIGVAAFPEDGQEPEELLHAADAALYQAKLQSDGIAAAKGKDTSFPVNNLQAPSAEEPD